MKPNKKMGFIMVIILLLGSQAIHASETKKRDEHLSVQENKTPKISPENLEDIFYNIEPGFTWIILWSEDASLPESDSNSQYCKLEILDKPLTYGSDDPIAKWTRYSLDGTKLETSEEAVPEPIIYNNRDIEKWIIEVGEASSTPSTYCGRSVDKIEFENSEGVDALDGWATHWILDRTTGVTLEYESYDSDFGFRLVSWDGNLPDIPVGEGEEDNDSPTTEKITVSQTLDGNDLSNRNDDNSGFSADLKVNYDANWDYSESCCDISVTFTLKGKMPYVENTDHSQLVIQRMMLLHSEGSISQEDDRWPEGIIVHTEYDLGTLDTADSVKVEITLDRGDWKETYFDEDISGDRKYIAVVLSTSWGVITSDPKLGSWKWTNTQTEEEANTGSDSIDGVPLPEVFLFFLVTTIIILIRKRRSRFIVKQD
ncbi:MAG: exported protein of unknown function [Promethearchaeota archaeon]|nr:MAG: exported protein of unknown function [Candidatus Lokiarchaeota archaeon]